MKIKAEIGSLGLHAWDVVQRTVNTSYEFRPDDVRVCVVLERIGATQERHAEMPVPEFRKLVKLLDLADALDVAGQRRAATAALVETSSGGPQDELLVRNDCAFCHRERTPKDDNHADDCPYWTVGPGSVR